MLQVDEFDSAVVGARPFGLPAHSFPFHQRPSGGAFARKFEGERRGRNCSADRFRLLSVNGASVAGISETTAVPFTTFISPTLKFGSALSFWVFCVRLPALRPCRRSSTFPVRCEPS